MANGEIDPSAPQSSDSHVNDPQASSFPLVGWREWVRLPGLGIKRIKAKVDTGAKSSSLHATDVEQFVRDGTPWVRFKASTSHGSPDKFVEVESPVHDFRPVKNSGGQAKVRPVIQTEMVLHGRTFAIELTLANRDNMNFRMLIGREALQGRFLVDSGGAFYSPKPKRKKKSV